MSEPNITIEDEDHGESSVRQVVYLEPSISVLKAMLKEKNEARDRSPVRGYVFPPAQEVYEQRRIALQQEGTQGVIAKNARVVAQQAEVKRWIETQYVAGKDIVFAMNNFENIESEVIAQLKKEGYQVHQLTTANIVFPPLM